MNRIDDLIHFNVPPFIPSAIEYMRDAVERHKICGDGRYTKLCNSWIEEQFGCRKALLTTSGSAALDMAALLCDVKPGDEVILPSFTFSSTSWAWSITSWNKSCSFATIFIYIKYNIIYALHCTIP